MNLVLTIAIGQNYEKLVEMTAPSMKAYANKIGAEFRCIRQKRLAQSYPYWEKFIIGELLESYDRLLYLDADTLVRHDCPNLFRIVPESSLGMYDEGLLTTEAERAEQLNIMQFTHKDYGKVYSGAWDGKFYNTGVIVVSKRNKALFKKPHHEMFAHYWDQAYLNMVLIENDSVHVVDLGFKFNRMPYVDIKVREPRTDSFIVHYAGLQEIYSLIRHDLEVWRAM